MPSNRGGTSAVSGLAPASTQLESWKEIASYLNRHVTTVRRWEREEGLPVHRHHHAKQGSVYAYSGELEAWLRSRRAGPAFDAGHLTVEGGPPQRMVLRPSPLVTAAGPSPVALIGRDTEWRRLREAWAAAGQGRSQFVLVTGDPGLGKTRLVLDFARDVSAEATVLVGRCDSEQLVPFAPFVEVLQWLLEASPAGTFQSWLASIDGSIELAQLAPEIARRGPVVSASGTVTADGRRYRMFEAFVALIRATSRGGPVLLLVEDVHWADRGSLLLLRHVVRALHDVPVCTIVTCCESEASHHPWTVDILESIRAEPSSTSLALGGLSEDDVRHLVTTTSAEAARPHLVTFVSDNTQGNPLFVLEMLKHLEDQAILARLERLDRGATLADLGLPQSIRHLIGRRLSRLTETCNKLLTLGAVIGREFYLPIVEAVAELTEEQVLTAVEEATAARILREVPPVAGWLAFTHSLVRDTLYAQLSGVRRVRLHHRIANAIEHQATPGQVPVAALAHHFGRAAPFADAEKAVAYAIRAGEQAAARLGFEEAARCYEMGLTALDFLTDGSVLTARRLDLHERRGRLFHQTGQWASARDQFETALGLLGTHDDTKRCDILVRLAEAAFWLMDVPSLRRFSSEAQRLAEHLGRDDLWADAVAWLGSADVADGNMAAALESDRRAVARAGGIRSFGLARSPLTLYWAGHMAKAVAQAAEAVEYARVATDPAFLLYALQHSGLSLSGVGRYDEALVAFDEARTFGRRCGGLPLLARATSMSVAPLLSLGDLEGAALRAREARELAHRVGFEPPLVSAGLDLLVIAARSGDPGQCDTLLSEVAEAVQRATGWHEWKWRLRLWHTRAELAAARHDWQEVMVAAGHVIEQSRARSRPKYEALGLRSRACAQARLGLRDAAEDADAAVEVARRLGDPALLLDCLGTLLDLNGSDELVAEADQTVRRILETLSPGRLRDAFLTHASEVTGGRVRPGD